MKLGSFRCSSLSQTKLFNKSDDKWLSTVIARICEHRIFQCRIILDGYVIDNMCVYQILIFYKEFDVKHKRKTESKINKIGRV